jgi:hypothetical protein
VSAIIQHEIEGCSIVRLFRQYDWKTFNATSAQGRKNSRSGRLDLTEAPRKLE